MSPFTKHFPHGRNESSRTPDDSKPTSPLSSRTSSWFHNKMNAPDVANDNPEVFVYNLAHKQTMRMPKRELMNKVGDCSDNYQTFPITASKVPIYLGNENDKHREWFASVHIPASIRMQKLWKNNGSFDKLYVTSF